MSSGQEAVDAKGPYACLPAATQFAQSTGAEVRFRIGWMHLHVPTRYNSGSRQHVHPQSRG